MADDKRTASERTTAQDIVETAFSKIKELGEGDEASRLFPGGVGWLELEVDSTEAGAPGVHVALKLGVPPKAVADLAASALLSQRPEADDEAGVSFNAEGHHIVALIAKADLEDRFPATLTAIENLLASVNRTLLEAAVFPDEIRNSQPQTKPFHFVDIPFETGGPANPALPAPPHVISKIAEFTAFLTSGGGTNQQKVDAISWLIHLFGDIHQPLHCTEHISEDHPGGDRGGNSFKLRGSARNLHSLWDSSADFSNADEEEVAVSIHQEHTRAALDRELAVTDVEAWARASFGLAKRFAYTLREDAANPPRPSAAYLARANQIGRQQVALAGYRLADRLKAIFG